MRPEATIPWSTCPAVLAAGCLALGILLAEVLPGLPVPVWMALVPGAMAPAALVLAGRRRRLVAPGRMVLYASTALALVALGAALRAAEDAFPPHHLARYVQETPAPVLIEGRVAGDPIRRPYHLRFPLVVERRLADGRAYPVTGRAQVEVRLPDEGPPPPALAPGDRLRLQARLAPLPRRRNPADFDYGAYLRRHGITARLTVDGPAQLTVVGRAPSLLERVVGRARATIRHRIDRYVPGATPQAVLTTLLLGDRSALDPGVRERFAATGLMHLLAVSGLHVLLVGFVFYGLLRPVLMRLAPRLSWRAVEAARSGLTLALLCFFMLLTGAPASVVRAVIMAAVLIGLNLLQRNAPTLNALGVAGFVMLLLRPLHLFDVGFQLSFAAVAGIVLLRPVLASLLPPAWLPEGRGRGVLTTVLVSLAATLATLPVLLYHFGYASFAGLVLNLPAIPLTAMTLLSGLLLAAGGGVGFLAEITGAAAAAFAGLLVAVAEHGAGVLGWARLDVYARGWVLAALIAGLAMLALWPRPRARARLLLLSAALLTIGLWTPDRPEGTLDVLFFDVGQGDAALLTLPGGGHLLLDAGVRNAYTDQGVRTLLPHLRRFGITHLDAIVISHPHSDHLGGLPALLRAVPVRRVLHNGDAHPSALYRETLHLLDSLSVPHAALRAGDTLHLDASVRLQVLAPAAPPGEDEDVNDASLVLRVAHGTRTFLFLGDAEAQAEQRLVTHYAPLLCSDVVKVGHHGSRTSSTPALVAAVVPDPARTPIAVISAGRTNPFGFPDPGVVRRWEARGARVWVTGRQGALWLRSDGHGIHLRSW